MLADNYLLLKTIHIVSSTLLFGTGLGTFFFMIRATRSGNAEAVRVTAGTVVLADWIFTSPAVVVQFVTGVLLMQILSFPFNSAWFLLVIGLFCLVGALWLPVVWIQIQLHRMLRDLRPGDPLPARFVRLVRLWELMGYPAFSMMVVIFAIMVYKPWLGAAIF
ncbi:Predicted integral membrane protein [gamma proteobacterium HdN1]|nr:Predicted integral membrane protein [gamma proteobacterium HdN1]